MKFLKRGTIAIFTQLDHIGIIFLSVSHTNDNASNHRINKEGDMEQVGHIFLNLGTPRAKAREVITIILCLS